MLINIRCYRSIRLYNRPEKRASTTSIIFPHSYRCKLLGIFADWFFLSFGIFPLYFLCFFEFSLLLFILLLLLRFHFLWYLTWVRWESLFFNAFIKQFHPLSRLLFLLCGVLTIFRFDQTRLRKSSFNFIWFLLFHTICFLFFLFFLFFLLFVLLFLSGHLTF